MTNWTLESYTNKDGNDYVRAYGKEDVVYYFVLEDGRYVFVDGISETDENLEEAAEALQDAGHDVDQTIFN